MRANLIAITALAAGASAWTYPDCEADNCYRAIGAEKNKAVAEPFCFAYLKAPVEVPSAFGNCKGDEKRISSACSCVTYTATHTSSASSSTGVPSSSTSKTTLDTTTTSSSYSSKTTKMTTSTITTTSIITVTTCPPSKPCHPTETQVITTYTTVCPEETTAPPPPTTSQGSSTPPPPPTTAPPKPTGTGAWPAPTKPGQAIVTAGAAENMAALKMVGAAAFAALLL